MEHVAELGIRKGDPIVPICPFTIFADEKLYMAKAFDNRAGCLVAVETLKSITGCKSSKCGIQRSDCAGGSRYSRSANERDNDTA